MSAIERSDHDLALPEGCRPSLRKGSVSRGITDRDSKFSICVGSKE